MKAAPFEYVRPASVDETVAALTSDAEGAEIKILAGGQSLVPLLALRMARPSVLVDINRVAELTGFAHYDGAVEVGALTRHRALADQTEHPLLAEAARWIGHPAIRSRGTAAGSLAHADPSAELPVVAVACGAVVTVIGPAGSRRVPAGELFLGPLMSALDEDELITSVSFPVPARWGFAEFARRHGDFALVSVAVAEVAGEVSIALGGVGGVPVRAVAGERVLAGGGSLDEVAAAVRAELRPTGDLHGSADYRRALAGELVRRALEQAGLGGGG
ncbi:MAG TPA: FAD binding domain-containing protein [Pseudonocardia sp.]|nr:FAD binding domain-containing protein [Pseudonocardia sp.]